MALQIWATLCSSGKDHVQVSNLKGEKKVAESLLWWNMLVVYFLCNTQCYIF